MASAFESTERLAPVSMMKRNGPWSLMLMSATARPAASRLVAPATLGASGSSGSQARAGAAIHSAPATNKAAAATLRKRAMSTTMRWRANALKQSATFPSNGTR